MKLNKKYYFIFIAIILFSCSSEKEVQKDEKELTKPLFENSINVNVNKIYSWINLMPNTPARFNITGEITLLKTEDYSLNDIELSEIKIYQQNEMFYRIKPIVKWNNNDVSNRSFLFSTTNGLSLIPNFNQDKNIDALFEFNYRGDKLLYFIQDIPIEKAN